MNYNIVLIIEKAEIAHPEKEEMYFCNVYYNMNKKQYIAINLNGEEIIIYDYVYNIVNPKVVEGFYCGDTSVFNKIIKL